VTNMRRALLVGIDHYSGSPLTGCVADARGMAGVLERHQGGGRNYDVKCVTSNAAAETITRQELRTLLAELFENARDTELVFFFAGHGGQTPWGAELVTQDFTRNSLGVSMNDVITLANDSSAREVTLILDCCFSGDIANIPGLQASAVAAPFLLDKAVLRENVTVLAASRATQTSAEVSGGGQGAFTQLLIEGLEGAAADHLGEVTALSLYAFASRAFTSWEQRPVFKSHVAQPSALRSCRPAMDAELLRQLPDHFSAADARVTMTPAHEGQGRPLSPDAPRTAEQAAFDYFKQLRNASLLTTDDNQDFYFATVELKDVYLTPLGRYFWRLAAGNRL
jgi:Caspase domain